MNPILDYAFELMHGVFKEFLVHQSRKPNQDPNYSLLGLTKDFDAVQVDSEGIKLAPDLFLAFLGVNHYRQLFHELFLLGRAITLVPLPEVDLFRPRGQHLRLIVACRRQKFAAIQCIVHGGAPFRSQ